MQSIVMRHSDDDLCSVTNIVFLIRKPLECESLSDDELEFLTEVTKNDYTS